jgi:hypothetical protein
MKYLTLFAAAAAMLASSAPAAVTHHTKAHAHPPRAEGAKKKGDESESLKEFFKPNEVRSSGTVTVGGQPIAYDAAS